MNFANVRMKRNKTKREATEMKEMFEEIIEHNAYITLVIGFIMGIFWKFCFIIGIIGIIAYMITKYTREE